MVQFFVCPAAPAQERGAGGPPHAFHALRRDVAMLLPGGLGIRGGEVRCVVGQLRAARAGGWGRATARFFETGGFGAALGNRAVCTTGAVVGAATFRSHIK